MPKKKKPKRPKNKPGQGRPPIADPKKSFAVYLRQKQKDEIMSKYGSLTAAMESLLTN